jgi:hypothetical protein
MPNAHPRFLRTLARPLVPVISTFRVRDRAGGVADLSGGSFDLAVDSHEGLLRYVPRLLRQEAGEALKSYRTIPVST